MDALTAGSPRQLEERPPGDGAAQKIVRNWSAEKEFRMPAMPF